MERRVGQCITEIDSSSLLDPSNQSIVLYLHHFMGKSPKGPSYSHFMLKHVFTFCLLMVMFRNNKQTHTPKNVFTTRVHLFVISWSYHQILKYVYASRNGLSETELFDLIPVMTHNFWVPLEIALLDHFVLVYRSGLLVFAHEQVSDTWAIEWSKSLHLYILVFYY